MGSVCIVAGAGEYYGHVIAPGPSDCVIAADGGFLRLQEMGVRVDEVIGDFDSLGFQPEHPRVRRLPTEKDDTDMLFALRVGIDRGFREFHLYGGTGGRLDHTLANIQCLLWLAKQGCRGYLYGKSAVFTALYDGEIAFQAREEGIVSVFALGGQANGVTIQGLKYTLNDASLACDYPLGVSNEFIGREARVAVKDGALLVGFPEDAVVR